jgi:hypothetical protein
VEKACRNTRGTVLGSHVLQRRSAAVRFSSTWNGMPQESASGGALCCAGPGPSLLQPVRGLLGPAASNKIWDRVAEWIVCTSMKEEDAK